MVPFRAFLLLLTIGFALAQYSCDDPPPDFECLCPQFQDTLQCKVCGYQGSSLVQCTAYNASFDDLGVKKAVADYQDTTWDSMLVAGKGPDNPIIPDSKKHYLRSLTGYGALSFTSGASTLGDNVGGLFNFSYACADPCTPTSSQRPVACTVTVTAGCEAVDYDDEIGMAFYWNETFPYDPAGARWAHMALGVWDNQLDTSGLNSSYVYYPAICWNYTFEATMANGAPAFLYLDDIITQSWT